VSIETLEEVSRTPLDDIAASTPFFIHESEADAGRDIAIPADQVMCHACGHEVMSPTHRRFRYPFTTCTDCGPRLTVVESVPYDRARTTLRAFPLCPACDAEYKDPLDRRFHAESTACPDCGPKLWVEFPKGVWADVNDPIVEVRRALAAGRIVAVRGLGGYQLICDALNPDAIRRLRARKVRPSKPLAVMARSLETASLFVDVSFVAERLMTGPAGPIVLLPGRTAPCSETERRLSVELISPDTGHIGMMLPTTPLHRLLFEPTHEADTVPAFELLVVTSGNHRGEPIATSNDQAREELSDICDVFLMHDREISIRNDDSVLLCWR
jgi:hydrogenase maturation protein HypF